MSVLNVRNKTRSLQKALPRVTLFIFVVAVLSPVLGYAGGQSASAHLPPELNRFPDKNHIENINANRAQSQNIEAANAVRRSLLEQDAIKLVKAASDVQSEVNQPGYKSVSPDVLRKVGEIERLARSVKDRMRLAAITQ